MDLQLTRPPERAIESNLKSNSDPIWGRRSGVYLCGSSFGWCPNSRLTLHSRCRTVHRVIPTRLQISQILRFGLVDLLALAANRGIEKALEMLTIKQVMRELRISRTSVWRLREAGRLKFYCLGSSVRIFRSDLDRFIANELTAGRKR